MLAALVADSAPADQRGAAFGVFNFVSGVAALVASLAAGALWDAIGPGATFLAGALVCAIGLVALSLAARVAPGLRARVGGAGKR